ncbi:XyeA family cyclophane-containing RiPP triceptide [Yersinia aleksiciae]|uniref:RSAM-modified RiPP, XyeA family n=1 Tax=Yersinia aleksiciae TaxID=263819 RepID=A0A0T9U1K9_YERAE|nr:XyeA family cyclophane-containing RiPP triceptide [Yersinia aleksiciae]CFQ39377.1 Uncharacterised protein [Yersinia aleksiciae]CNL14176.1 Uncharacterised protein [Yersinia aleksiciae]
MSRLKKEITATKTVINVSEVKKNQPQRLAEDVLEQISGGWVNAFLRWGKSF